MPNSNGGKERKTSRLSMPYLVRQNTTRRHFRTAVTIISIAVMIATLFASQLFTQGVSYGLQTGTERLGADLIVVPQGSSQAAQTWLLSGTAQYFYMNESVLPQIQALSDVSQASPQILLTSLAGVTCCSSGNLQVVGIDPQTDFTIMPWLMKPLPGGFDNGQGVTGSQILGNFGSLEPEFFGQNFSLVGELFPMNLGLDNSFYITISDARHIIQLNQEGLLPNKLPITIQSDQISDVIVRVKDGVSVAAAAAQVKANIPGVDVVTASVLTTTVASELNGMQERIYVAGGAVWGVSLVMIGAVFSMSVNERRREIGLMRSLGSTSRFIYGLITLEGTLQTVIGGAIGLGVGAFAIYLFNGVLAKAAQLIFVWPSSSQIVVLVLESLAIAVAIGVAASAYPAYASSKMEPYAAVRQE